MVTYFEINRTRIKGWVAGLKYNPNKITGLYLEYKWIYRGKDSTTAKRKNHNTENFWIYNFRLINLSTGMVTNERFHGSDDPKFHRSYTYMAERLIEYKIFVDGVE